jgi:hypothetical protein
MTRKMRSKLLPIIFAGILFCVIFAGVVEGAETKERNDVTVTSSETELIESTYTDKWHNRLFHVENGGNEIIATIWGSNDDETWEYWDSVTIGNNENENMVLGPNHYWYVKLTGRTTGSSSASIVDATLHFHIP